MPSNSLARKALEFNVLFRRAKKRLSQQELAKRAKISRTVLSGIENGEHNPTLDILDRLADALDTTIAELFTRIETAEETEAEAIERRDKDGEDAYVNADDFIAAIADRGRRKALQH